MRSPRLPHGDHQHDQEPEQERRPQRPSATEACIAFTGARGVVLPYGYYGPYVERL
jgi:hypothetical protein